jgi:hypothetical protein
MLYGVAAANELGLLADGRIVLPTLVVIYVGMAIFARPALARFGRAGLSHRLAGRHAGSGHCLGLDKEG